MDWVVGVLLNVTLGLRAEGPAAFGSSGRSPRMTTSFLCPGLVPGPRLGPGINPGHRSACARPPRIPQDQRYDISLRSACPENRFPLFGADLHTGTAGREASHRSVILCRCSARQPARKPLPPFRSQCSCWSNSFTRSRFDSAHANSRPSGPFAAPLGRPDRPARSRACLASGSEEVLLPNLRECCPTRSKHVVQYARIPPGDGVGWPGGSDVEGSDTLHLRPAAVTDRTCRSLRPTAHRFACADVPRAAGKRTINHYRINVNRKCVLNLNPG
jgi:hypothetical protein